MLLQLDFRGARGSIRDQRCAKIQEAILRRALAATRAGRAAWIHGFTAKTAESTENSLVEDYRADAAGPQKETASTCGRQDQIQEHPITTQGQTDPPCPEA